MSTVTSPLIWLDGKLGAQPSALDRGLAYGDGLFETCRLQDGRIPLWQHHLRRLQTSAAAFALELNTAQLHTWLTAALAHLHQHNIHQGTVKVMLTRGVGGRGYQLPPMATPTVLLLVYPDNLDVLRAPQTPLRIRVCRTPLGRNRVLAGHKHLNRLENVLARAEWQCDEFDEGLMLDDGAHVIEATAHNVFMYRQGCWYTPALDEAGVAGVMRQLLIDELAPRCKVPVVIAPITLADIYQADEIILCNSNRGIRPVAELTDGSGVLHRFLQHDNAQRLTAVLSDLLQGKGTIK